MDYSAIVELEAMSVQEARECIEEIKRHQTHIRMLLFVLEERKGWQVLGYSSMRECMVAEFGRSQSQLYRELKAAKIEREISPIGEIGTIPEGCLRPVGKLPKEQWANAWNQAVSTAPAKGVTAKHVAEVVSRLLQEDAEAIASLEDFYVGDWVEIQCPGAWYEKRGEVIEVGKFEIAVKLDQKKTRILRFYREQLKKVLPFTANETIQESFYNPGDLALIDCPVNCDYRQYRGCWGVVVKGTTASGNVEIRVAGKNVIVMKSDLDPIDAPTSELKDVAAKANELLARDDLDLFDRRTIEMYLREQSFTERQLKRLDSIWNDYCAS